MRVDGMCLYTHHYTRFKVTLKLGKIAFLPLKASYLLSLLSHVLLEQKQTLPFMSLLCSELLIKL